MGKWVRTTLMRAVMEGGGGGGRKGLAVVWRIGIVVQVIF